MKSPKEKIDQASDETKILRKYKEPVIRELIRLRSHREMSQVCREKLGGIATARLTELIQGKRELTMYYLGKFLRGGIVNLKQILAGRKMEDLPYEDRALLRKLAMRDDLAVLIGEFEDDGFDVYEHLKNIRNMGKGKKQ